MHNLKKNIHTRLNILPPHKRSLSILLILLLCCLSPHSAFANKEAEAPFCGIQSITAARSIDTLIPALYEVVSGDAGSNKNWALLRNLFAKQAIITPVFHSKTGQTIASINTVDEFIQLNKKLFKDKNFYETEVSRRTFTFGHMANVLSYYESRDTKYGAPYARGINSFQLLNDGARWCVISVTWDSHNESHPLSAKPFDR